MRAPAPTRVVLSLAAVVGPLFGAAAIVGADPVGASTSPVAAPPAQPGAPETGSAPGAVAPPPAAAPRAIVRPKIGADGLPIAEPEAAARFAEFLAAYRAIPALRVKTTTTIDARDGDAAARSRTVDAELLHATVGDRRRGRLSLRGYTLWLGGGELAAIHESNDAAYFAQPDDGSPFYALLLSFRELPFPDLALAFGEAAPEDVLMQLHPQAPDVVPVAFVEEEVDGVKRRRIELASERESISIVVDPETGLPRSMTTIIEGTAGPAAGTEVRYEHTFEYERPEPGAIAEAFAFDAGVRQKVDLLAALAKAEERPAAGGPRRIGADGMPVHSLVGERVPGLVLPLLERGGPPGAVLDLGASDGRVLVLDFWALWCGPCKAAMPGLHEAAALFRDEEAPVAFYAVNVYEKEPDLAKRHEAVRTYWTAQKFTLPVAMDDAGEAGKAFEVSGIPMTVVVRSDGIVHAVHVGFNKQRLIESVRGAIAALEAPEP